MAGNPKDAELGPDSMAGAIDLGAMYLGGTHAAEDSRSIRPATTSLKARSSVRFAPHGGFGSGATRSGEGYLDVDGVARDPSGGVVDEEEKALAAVMGLSESGGDVRTSAIRRDGKPKL